MASPNPDHEKNRVSWNAATVRHNTHRGDQATFFRTDGSTLFPEEVALLGYINGKTLLHLQCNAGQDSISIASKLGAQVTGVDISDEAIQFARQLARESGIGATFVRSDLFDWFDANTQQFDVVFTSYGTTCWLNDLDRWAHGIAAALKPGGRFVMIEFHPMLVAFNEQWQLDVDYMGGRAMYYNTGVYDYVGDSSGSETGMGTRGENSEGWINPNPSVEFLWGIADHVRPLLAAGLALTGLEEYPYVNGWKPFADMVERAGRRMYPPEDKPVIPCMFSLTASKPTG